MKRIALNLLIALYVTGCGAADDKAAQSTATGPGAQTAQTPVSEKDPTKPTFTSMAVADASGLPACDRDSDGFLAYVKADKTIQACVDGSWTVVDLKGDKGDQGATGPAGAAAQAVQAVAKTPMIPGPNEFLEEGTGLVWTKGTNLITFDIAKIACQREGYRFPTEDEFKVAIAINSLPAGAAYIWTDTGRLALPGNAQLIIDVEPTDRGLAFCVKLK